MANYPDFRWYDLVNNNTADTIYPLLYDQWGKLIWDGRKYANYEVLANAHRQFDVTTFPNGPPSQTVIILGCAVKDSGRELKDPTQPKIYKDTSPYMVKGTYGEDGSFNVSLGHYSSLDAAAALQEAYAKLNSSSVAKFLVTVAGLISPEV